MRKSFALAFLVTALVAIPVVAEEIGPELKAEVPALSALHEVIAPLWHGAWPEKNVGMIRQSLPDLQKGVKALASAELPGILRDKAPAWKAGVADLEKNVAAIEKGAAANDDKAMLDALEEVHSAYEGLVRVVRPPMKELDAYHQVLYGLYHKALPANDVAAIRAAGVELGTKCDALTAAPMPRRATGREEKVKTAIAALCKATADLRALPADAAKDAYAAAVEKVHAAYQAAESSFE